MFNEFKSEILRQIIQIKKKQKGTLHPICNCIHFDLHYVQVFIALYEN